MNLLNRVFMVLASLMMLILAVGTVWVAWTAPRELASFLRVLALFASNDPGTLRLVITAAAGVAILFFLLILLAEVSPESRDDIQIKNVKGGHAKVSVDLVRERIINDLSQLEHIQSVAPTVKSRGSAADIHVAAQLSNNSYQNEANAVLQVIRDSIEKDLGVKIRRLNATLTTKPLKEGRSARTVRTRPQNEEPIIVPEVTSEEPLPVHGQRDVEPDRRLTNEEAVAPHLYSQESRDKEELRPRVKDEPL